MKIKYVLCAFTVLLFLPVVTLAQRTTVWTTFSVAFDIVASLLTMGGTLAVVAFFYGLANFILISGDEKKRDGAKSIMIWGVVGMFVMVTIWGILGFMQATLGNTTGVGTVDIVTPTLPL